MEMFTGAGPWRQWQERWSDTWRRALSSYWVRLNVGIVIHRKVKGYGGSICYSLFHTICTFIYFMAHHTLGWDLSTLSVTNLSGVPTLGPPCCKPTYYCLSYATLCLTYDLRLTLSQLRRKLSEKLQTNSLYTPPFVPVQSATSQHTSTSTY
jgi:hypothetical protein